VSREPIEDFAEGGRGGGVGLGEKLGCSVPLAMASLSLQTIAVVAVDPQAQSSPAACPRSARRRQMGTVLVSQVPQRTVIALLVVA